MINMARKKAREIASFQIIDEAKQVFNQYQQRHVKKSKTDCYNALIASFSSEARLKKMIMEFQPTLLENNINATPTLDQTPTLDDPIVEINALQQEERYSDHDTALFDCHKFCRQFPRCTSRAVNGEIGEIIADRCYVSKYPYQWTTREGKTVRVCKFMVFPNGFPDDPKNPYPRCIAKQKDIIIQLPKDRIMRNPENCWTCYMDQKKVREEADRIKKVRRDNALYRGQPKVNWGKAEGAPPFSSY